jgi:hypothetical protein
MQDNSVGAQWRRIASQRGAGAQPTWRAANRPRAPFDRIRAGDSRDKLYAYLSGVQSDSLDMPKSDAFRAIVDRAVDLVGSVR